MALKNKNQAISLYAQSVVSTPDKDDPSKNVEVVALYFNATIDSAATQNMSINRVFSDSALYREHRTECLADQTAFEDAVYAIVDSMTPKEARSETI